MTLSKLAIAVLLGGVWLIIASQEPVGSTLTLIFGIVIVVLAVWDGAVVVVERQRNGPKYG